MQQHLREQNGIWAVFKVNSSGNFDVGMHEHTHASIGLIWGTPLCVVRKSRSDGGRLVIEPVRSRGLAALLDSREPLAEEFPEIADPPPTPEPRAPAAGDFGLRRGPSDAITR